MDDDEAVFTEPVEQVVPVLFSIPNGMLEDYRPVFVRRAYLLPVSVLAAIQATLDDYPAGPPPAPPGEEN